MLVVATDRLSVCVVVPVLVVTADRLSVCVVVPVLVVAAVRVSVGVLVSVAVPVWEAVTVPVLVTITVVALGVVDVLVITPLVLALRVTVPVSVTVMVELTTVWDWVLLWVAVPTGTTSNTYPLAPMPENSQRPAWLFRRQKRSPFSQSAPNSLKRVAFSPGIPCIDSALSTTIRTFGLWSWYFTTSIGLTRA